MRIFYLDKTWSTNSAKHFTCCDWTIGGTTATVGLHLFKPLGNITEIGDSVTACANWAQCKAWLRGDRMLTHINAQCIRFRFVACELTSAIEVMTMSLRKPCESQGGISPMDRVQAAMPIPTVSMDKK
jgi:hypothetical protein